MIETSLQKLSKSKSSGGEGGGEVSNPLLSKPKRLPTEKPARSYLVKVKHSEILNVLLNHNFHFSIIILYSLYWYKLYNRENADKSD